MIGVSWNCRGLGNPLTVQELTRITNLKKPDFVFLMETKCSHSDLETLIIILGFDYLHVVDCDSSYGGKRGGLCLMWKETLNLRILSDSLHHIDAEVYDQVGNAAWHLTGLYGWAEDNEKHRTWQLLRDLHTNTSSAWLCVGDLNEILCSTEKVGGLRRTLPKMMAFRDAIECCDLNDLGFSGYQFTWTNNQIGDANIQERLDRCLANQQWIHYFPSYEVKHLVRFQSDHCPILLSWNKSMGASTRRKGKKHFRFEAMWLHEASCPEVVETTWEGHRPATSPHEFRQKMCVIGEALQNWERDKFGNVNAQIDSFHNALERAQAALPSEENFRCCQAIEGALKDLMTKKEIMWRQRSRSLWLKEGDRNTSFFHKTATGRKKRNLIRGIKQEDGIWVEDSLSIERIFLNYFQHIFGREPSSHLDEVLEAIIPRVSDEINVDLSQCFTADEVTSALNQMHPLKAPGPDGLPVLFFTKFWPTVKDDTLTTVLNILNNDLSPAAINHTHIILIPKKKNPETPQDFRPISLCNVVMKLVTKCIANRLKPLLHNLISPAQSAFIPGRLITDNALIAFELFHTMKNNKSQNLSSFALKLDMSKAYDRVEWPFLINVMTRLGFPNSFTSLILRCVSTVSYSVMVNGKPSKSFEPSRGLRQGDPLSPYLFLMCAEALSAMLTNAETTGSLHGARTCKHGPPISHLFFADDSLIFGKASIAEISTVKNILDRFTGASGQRVNFEKSEIAFSRNISDEVANSLGGLCGIPVVRNHGFYLGLPASIGRSKKEIFSSITERVLKKLKNWKVRSLSQAGKLTLIKSVAQSIPSYVMSCFLLPRSVTHRINQIIANFWWGQRSQERKIHWCKWDVACSPKNRGGLGLREIECFNLAFLAKQGWRILSQPHSLLTRCLKARDFPRCSFLQAKLGYSPSFAWRSIIQGGCIIRDGIKWTIRDGQTVNILGDPWIPNQPFLTHPSPSSLVLQGIKVVRDLFTDEGSGWNHNLIAHLFTPQVASTITSIPISLTTQSDCVRWIYTKNGAYSVKSGYWIAKKLKDASSSNSLTSALSLDNWRWVWNLRLPPKIGIFAWRCLRGILPSKTLLSKRRMHIDPICTCCGSGQETLEHIFRDCSWTSFFWRACPLRISPPATADRTTLHEWLALCIRNKSAEYIEFFISLLWSVWKARNLREFQSKQLSHTDCFLMAHNMMVEFQNANRKPMLSTNVSSHPSCWLPPPEGQVKLNSDASISSAGNAGLGGGFRSHNAELIKTFALFRPNCNDVELAEALACLQGIWIAREEGYKNLVVESDNQCLILTLRQGLIPRTLVGTVIGDIFHLSKDFDQIEFSWIGRHQNRLAHHIASLAHNPGAIFDVDNPFFGSILHIVSSDALGLNE